MTPACLGWVEACVRKSPAQGEVLELGSMNCNGTPRSIFTDPSRFPSRFTKYVGVDMRAGLDVDVIANSNFLPFPDNSFDTLVCCEMLEHDLAFWFTFNEAYRVLRPGGIIIVTTRANGFPRHDYPSDYYRFSQEALGHLLLSFGFTNVGAREDDTDQGTFGIGQKPCAS
jgi:SAM-dependent methyltransferase